ncbi:MAG: FxsA family protein [Ilumatobacteraceae bacterium]
MILFVLFIVAPIVELYVLIKTGQTIGAVNTIGLLFVIAMLGSWLIKREGLKVWNRFATQVQSGQVPSKEIADGVCLLVAGILMVAPGFVSDVFAVLLLFPPTRAVARTWLLRRKRLGGLGRTAVIKATYGGRMPSHDHVTDTTATETRGEIERNP